MQVRRKSILRLLGRFTLQVDGDPVIPIRISSRKGCGLVAYLAMQRTQGVSREALATLLWGDQDDRLARQNLRQCLTSLRADLASTAPDLLVFESDMVALDFAALTVDACEFMALAELSATADLIRAAALYHGEFLAGFSFDVEPFDEWVRGERGRIEVAASTVFAFCATHFDGLGNGTRAVEAAERLTALDPLREEWQRLLLRVYARYRGSDAALTHGNILTALLKRELGVEPDGATRNLLAEIRSGALGPVPAAEPPIGAAERAAEAGVPPESRGQASATTFSPAHAVLTKMRTALSRTQATIAIVGTVALLVGGLAVASRPGTVPEQAGNPWTPPKLPSDLAGKMTALKARAVVPLIVWPFETPEDGNDRKIADALTDDLITNLSHNARLRVISRQTSYHYRAHATDAVAVGAKLGVSFVVEGSVRTQDSRVHVNVQLVDTATGLQVWADQFERNEIDRFDVQIEIARRLARELRVEMMISAVDYHRKQSKPAIAELIAKGWAAHFRGPSKANISKAIGYFEQALQREPRLVSALVGITAVLTSGSLNYVLNPEPSLERAEKLIAQALRINSQASSANYWMGLVHKAQGRYDRAMKSFQLAIELNPSFAPAYAQSGITLTLVGHAKEAMPYIRYAMRLSPRDRTMRFWTMFAGVTEFELGNDEAALDWLRKSAAYVPQSPRTYIFLAAFHALAGNKTAAAKYAAKFRKFADSTAVANLMEQITLGGRGKFANVNRLRSGLELAFGSSS